MQKWHPDKITSGRVDAEEAKSRFQQVHEAYQGNQKAQILCFSCVSSAICIIFFGRISEYEFFFCLSRANAVLSDEKRRALYDSGMYDPLDDDQEEDVEVIH